MNIEAQLLLPVRDTTVFTACCAEPPRDECHRVCLSIEPTIAESVRNDARLVVQRRFDRARHGGVAESARHLLESGGSAVGSFGADGLVGGGDVYSVGTAISTSGI